MFVCVGGGQNTYCAVCNEGGGGDYARMSHFTSPTPNSVQFQTLVPIYPLMP